MKIVSDSVLTFSKNNKPTISAEPGEILKFITMDCFGNQISCEKQLVHEIDFSKANPAAGPVYIKGAEKGDVLVVDILDIKVADKGFACTIEGLGPLSEGSEVRTRVFEIKDGMTSFNGLKWHINPMVGVIGTAPSGDDVPCGMPGSHGGNMDNNLHTKGSRLYFPVRVDGALLQMGDIHASMGNGEICCTGIEIAGEITIKTSLIKKFELNWPVTETSDHWYVNASANDFNEASTNAAEEMARLVKDAYGWDRTDAFIYFSVQGSMELSQSVTPVPNPIGISVRLGIPKTTQMKRII